jgi:serralysin
MSVASAAIPPAASNLPAATQAAPYYSCVTNWYVDAVKGSNSNPGTSVSAAFRTIGKATWQNAKLAAGGCVNVAPGTYNEFVWLWNSANQGGSANSPTGFVVLRSSTPLAAKIVGPSTNGYSVVNLPASFAVVDGFDVSSGDGGHCIDGGYNYTTNHAHHLIVINNHVHNCGGSGISTAGGDYYTIVGNTSNNNAATNGYQTSGISIFEPINANALPGYTPNALDLSYYYHNVISNNISYVNVETFSCSAYGMGAGCHTDGNGIIMDCFDCNGVGVYNWQTLIVGNLVYGNGGWGIEVGRSSNVTVANNTSYGNYTDVNNNGTARGELGNAGGSNTIWVNNIAWAVPAAGILSHNVTLSDFGTITISGITYDVTPSNVIWNNDIYNGAGVSPWGGSTISTTTNFNENPGLVSVGSGNFSLLSSSPAQGKGLPEGFLSSATPDIGAY